MKRRFFSAVLSAMILAVTSVGVTAYAEETASENQETTVAEMAESTEKTSENVTTEISETSETTTTTVDYFADKYYDTDGNATLIKEENIIYNSEKMQFIAVTTKDGHIFYVLINYSAENGEDNVYFLNKVDAVDLYSLIYMTDEEKENGIDMNNVERAENAALNAFGNEKPNSEKSDNSESEDNSNSDTAEQKQPVNKPMSANNLYLIIGAVSILGIGGAGFFIMKKKPKNKAVAETEEDEEINFYDDSENEDEE